MFSAGVWSSLHELKDPELQRLAGTLPDTVLQSRASSTTQKYLYAYKRWKTWADARPEVSAFPVNEVHFALYLVHLGESLSSAASVQVALNAVSWVHQLASLPPPSASAFVRATVAGLQCQLAKPKIRKEPITPTMLSAMKRSLGANLTLSEVRLLAIALLSFLAFLRFDELSKLCCCDVTFDTSSMSVHISSSKTDQYRQGADVLVARTGTPVAMLEHYFLLAGLDHVSELPLFRGITSTKRGECHKSGALSYILCTCALRAYIVVMVACVQCTGLYIGRVQCMIQSSARYSFG